MRKIFTLFIMLMLFTCLFTGLASAHVVVFPKEAVQGSYEKFTARVPSEKDVPTIKVEIKIPETVEISRTMPLAGWTSVLTKDANGKVISVLWTTTADGLASTEFGEFSMQGKIDKAATSIVWKAIQTYKDSSIVEWTGDEKSEHPASLTKVNPASANTAVAADGDLVSNAATSSGLPLYLSIAAIALALLALIITLRRKAQ
jgi:uncharacterized protein YcnI